MLLNSLSEKDSTNLEVLNFWKGIFVNSNYKVMNNEMWSNSHLNIIAEDRDEIISFFKKHKIQAIKGVSYLSHAIKPYI